MHLRPAAGRLVRGLTLVEVGVVLSISALLTTLAAPSWIDQLTRSRRVDATAALQRLQLAQERHRQAHGHYAERLEQLGAAAVDRSEAGHYRVELRSHGPDAYDAVAQAQAFQARDQACATITLRVKGLISQRDPTERCWGS